MRIFPHSSMSSGRRPSNPHRDFTTWSGPKNVENHLIYLVFLLYRRHWSVLPVGRSFSANARTKVAVLTKDKSSTANSGTKVAVLLRINRCGSFRCFPHLAIIIDTNWNKLCLRVSYFFYPRLTSLLIKTGKILTPLTGSTNDTYVSPQLY